MMKRPAVLFVCVHNSARSQMAEAFLKKHAGGFFEVASAGIEPGVLNPVVVDALKEIGIDISMNRTKDAFEFLKLGKTFQYVITVCDEANGERCPIFPGVSQRLHWTFDDPSAIKGSYEAKLAATRVIRDAIKSRILEFIQHQVPSGAGVETAT